LIDFANSTICELGVQTFLLSALAARERNKYRNAVRLLMPSLSAIAADDSPLSFSLLDNHLCKVAVVPTAFISPSIFTADFQIESRLN
jgi:hypothetical protein